MAKIPPAIKLEGGGEVKALIALPLKKSFFYGTFRTWRTFSKVAGRSYLAISSQENFQKFPEVRKTLLFFDKIF